MRAMYDISIQNERVFVTGTLKTQNGSKELIILIYMLNVSDVVKDYEYGKCINICTFTHIIK
jgi:hypothetical protein